MNNFQSVQKDITLKPQRDFCIKTKEEFFVNYLTKTWFKKYEKINPGITKIKINLNNKKKDGILREHLQEGDLFSPYKLIVINNFQNIAKEDLALLSNIIIQPTKKIGFMFFSTKKFPLKKKNPVVDYDLSKKLYPNEIASIIKWIVKEEGGFIDDDAVNLLLDFSGNNIIQIYNEILKLLNYNDKSYINKNSVLSLAIRIKEENIFDLTDSLSFGHKKTAIKLVNNLIEQGTYPLQILAVVSTHFTRLFQIKKAMLEKKDKKTIAFDTGYKEFYLNKLMNQAHGLSLNRITIILNKLSELEIKIKNNKIPPQLFWDGFILDI